MALQPNEVKTENIATGAVTTQKITDEAISTAKLKNNAVTTEKLATGAITGSKMADNCVTGSKIRDGVIRSEKIASGAITTSKIGEQQVTGSRLQDRAVTTEKIANSAVTTTQIADRAVTSAKLSFTPPSVARPITPPITTDEIGGLQVTGSKLQNGCVTQEKLDPGLAFGTNIVYLAAPVLAFNDGGGIVDIDALVDLSAWVPAGAKGIIGRLTIFPQDVIVTFVQAHIRSTADDTLPLARVSFEPGASAWNPADDAFIGPLYAVTPTREIYLKAGKSGQQVVVQITIIGYTI